MGHLNENNLLFNVENNKNKFIWEKTINTITSTFQYIKSVSLNLIL